MDKQRKAYLVANPEEVESDEFCFELLDAIFKEHVGYGGGERKFNVGGQEFTREIKPVFSNSMKSKSFKIKFFSYEYEFENETNHDDNKRQRATKERKKAKLREVLKSLNNK